MRNILLLILAVLTVAQGQELWTWLNPLPQGNPLQSVFFVNSDTGYAVGDLGTIIKTDDGGNSWTLQNSGTEKNLESVYFVDTSIGYSVGDGGVILKTTNGGIEWTVNQVPGVFNTLYLVNFFNPDNGYIVGSNGVIRKTTNGGVDWINQNSTVTSTLFAASFVNSDTGFVVGSSGKILKTINGGIVWEPQDSQTIISLYSVYFVDADTGYVVGSSGFLAKTTNGGFTWDTLNQLPSSVLWSIYFTDTNTGYAVGSPGTIFRTSNGGVNWELLNSGTNVELLSTCFVNSNIGFCVGWDGAILKTANAGDEWISQRSGFTTEIYDVFFTSETNGYAVGEQGSIFKTTDKGINWESQFSGVSSYLYSTHFVDADTGYVVGSSGTILKTKDGTNWASKVSGVATILYSVHFPTARIGYAVGWSGKILKTTNYGNDWLSQTSPTTSALNSVYFIDTNIGYAVGTGGTILKTTSGGTPWDTLDSGVSEDLYSVQFISPTTGVVAGEFGTILKTTDGGMNWINTINNTLSSFRALHLLPTGIGYAVGYGGDITKTIDSGENWFVIENIPTEKLFNSVYINNSGTAFVGGSDGTILFNGANLPPTIDTFTANPASGVAPLSVSFTCQANDPDGIISEYQWDFDGDNTIDDITTIGSNNFTYDIAGVYEAKCTVIDDAGGMASETIIVNIYSNITRLVSIPDTSATEGSTLQIPVVISDASGLAGAELRLSYNSSVLDAFNVSTTNLTDDFIIVDSISPGQVLVALSSTEGIDSGEGALITIAFNVAPSAQNGDTTTIKLNSVTLFDANTDTIPAITENGLFTVQGDFSLIFFVEPKSDTLSINQTQDFSFYRYINDTSSTNVFADWTLENVFGNIGSLSPIRAHTTTFTATGVGNGIIIGSPNPLLPSDTAIVIVGEMKGDINADDIVNVADAILCLRIIVNLLTPALYQLWAADFNDSGAVPDVGDAIGILRESLKNIRIISLPTGSGIATVRVGNPVPIAGTDFVDVSIFVDNRPDVAGMDLGITYNNGDFELLEATGISSSLVAKNLQSPEVACVSAVKLEGLLDNNNAILTLRFKTLNSPQSDLGITIEHVRLFDPMGEAIQTDIALVGVPADNEAIIPENFQLLQNFPNPFNPTTTIPFGLPKAGHAKLIVYNLAGAMIRTLVDQPMSAGIHSVTWNGRDMSGKSVVSSIYFYQLTIDGGAWQATNKMILLK